jgi:hypothetical protein
MDPIVKAKLNKFFIENFSKMYKSTPELKPEGNDYYYTVNKDSNIICLMPILKI